MKIFEKSLLKWWDMEIDYLASNFIKKIKEFEKVKYDKKKKNLMINEGISEIETRELLFLIDLFGYTDLFKRLNELELHIISQKRRKRSLCRKGQWYKLKGKSVFNGMLSPRFWLEWEATYQVTNKWMTLLSGVIDRPVCYQLLIKRRIQAEMSHYVMEVGDKNSASWLYDADMFLNKKQGTPIKPENYLDFGLILNHAKENRLTRDFMSTGISIRLLHVMDYGPIDKPYLGLWKIKRDLEGKKMAEFYQPTLSRIDQIRASLAKGSIPVKAVQSQTLPHIAQGSKSKILSKEIKAFVAYLPTSTGIGTEISDISEKEISEKYLQKKSDYFIFIYTRGVFVKIGKELKSIQMDKRIYKLLVIFLRQKDLLIPPIPLYRKAWAGSPLKISDIRDERDISPYLKTAISELRALLKDVPDFEITKARFEGYICKGKFQFCAIIPKAEEKKYILSEVEEQEADLST